MNVACNLNITRCYDQIGIRYWTFNPEIAGSNPVGSTNYKLKMKYFKENNDWLIIDKENAIFIQDQSAIKCLYYYCLSFCLLFYKKNYVKQEKTS